MMNWIEGSSLISWDLPSLMSGEGILSAYYLLTRISYKKKEKKYLTNYGKITRLIYVFSKV